MSVYSMTGYASASGGAARPVPAALHEVELRSVNGRFLDIQLRLSDEYRSLEPQLRALVSARVKRGKVELRVTSGAGTGAALPEPSPEQLAHLGRIEGRVRELLPQARPISVHEALQWFRGGAAEAAPDDALVATTTRCLDSFLDARAREGERLAVVMRETVEHLRRLAAAAEPLVPEAIARAEKRFIERWNEALAKSGAEQSVGRDAVGERALNEAAAYAIRIDVAEELARLRAHLDETTRLLGAGGEIGKRLEFIVQELLREANTLGSKSSSIEMTTIAVDMKVAIEQLREQAQNVE